MADYKEQVFFNVPLNRLEPIFKGWIREVQNEAPKTTQLQNHSEVLMDEAEACAFLKTNSVTLWRWVKAGKIKVYKFSHKNYYKRNEILETITQLQK
jgi:hypothetical protein